MSVRGKGSMVFPEHAGPEKPSPMVNGQVQCLSSTNPGQPVAETAVNSSGKSSAPITLDPDSSPAPCCRARTHTLELENRFLLFGMHHWGTVHRSVISLGWTICSAPFNVSHR